MKIGILGGSSQVGSSVAYYLKKKPGVDVICFIRSKYSQPFFDLLEIPYEQINYNDRVSLKAKLSNCDAVLDFSYPTGQLSSIKKNVKENISGILSSLPTNTIYIYMSSIMAYGMLPQEKYIRNYLIPKSSYAYIKRTAENLVTKLGKKYKLKTYNFRLGQVHGILQSVNSSFREKLTANNVVYIDGTPDQLTNTIFVNSIANAILICIKEDINPDTYTLVSTPQWTLGQLYEYYLNYYNLHTQLIYFPAKHKTKKWLFKIYIFNLLKKYRHLLETYVLLNFPFLSIKIKGRFRQNEVAHLISENKDCDYFDVNLLGKPSKKILPTHEATFANVKEEEITFDNFYSELIFMSRK